MDSPRLPHLVFLFSAASVAAGCSLNITGEDDTDTGASSGMGGNGGTTGATSNVETGAAASSGGSELTSGSADSAADETAGSADVCASYAANYVECFPRAGYDAPTLESECRFSLGGYTAVYGEACASALEDYFACLAMIDCEAWVAAQEAEEGACPGEVAAFQEACAGSTGSTG